MILAKNSPAITGLGGFFGLLFVLLPQVTPSLEVKDMPRRKPRCVCEEPGAFNCGIPGILTGPRFKNGARYVERCDTCVRFAFDDDACIEYVRLRGGICALDREKRIFWIPGWLSLQAL